MQACARMLLLFAICLLTATVCYAPIDRRSIVSRYNPVRNVSSTSTPVQVGNGNFAFGMDVTGLQTFQPFAILSSWGWKNDSLPDGTTEADVERYHGASWLDHGRPVEYDFGGEPTAIEQWLIANPNRVNLGRIGLAFFDDAGALLTNVSEADLTSLRQELNLWTGIAQSEYEWAGAEVRVTTSCADRADAVVITVSSPLLAAGRLGVFFDFPWTDGTNKFSAPFVGVYNATDKHTTTLRTVDDHRSDLTHELGSSTFLTSIESQENITITRDSPNAHRYTLTSQDGTENLVLVVTFSRDIERSLAPEVDFSHNASAMAWEDYWTQSGFVDVISGSSDEHADELQRRIILSRYLVRVNEAPDASGPQESGLVNNGWYGEVSTVVRATADWMASYAWWNASAGVYDLGPPMYVVSEDTHPNATRNPAFELAYWRLGLGIAERWMEELGEEVPASWTEVRENLASLPVHDGKYKVYEDIEDDFWTREEYTNDHPALTGLYGWLPETSGLDLGIAKTTAESVWSSWNISNCWGWDFPMLAMSAARLGDADKAVDWLLHPLFEFDDVGMPVGGVRVPTPYFPGSGGLLYAVAMMAAGWDGSQGTAPGFPEQGWNVTVEGMSRAL
uniref:Glycoside hydrolase family 65 protein n=1 Tax=Schizophyllum commune (strain H4-8 / FGSC 9210) TaxID=578458 RepID=D8QLA6_SCHCM